MIEGVGGDHYALVMGLRLSQRASPAELLRHVRSLAIGCETQLMRPDVIVDVEHLVVAAEHAVTAFDRGFPISKSLAMESILYASGERQIEKAIEKIGIRSGDTTAALLLISKRADDLHRGMQSIENANIGKTDEALIGAWTPEKRTRIIEIFDLTARQIRAARRVGESERDAIKKLVLEKMALVSLGAQRS